jgi:hypothetical protein
VEASVRRALKDVSPGSVRSARDLAERLTAELAR